MPNSTSRESHACVAMLGKNEPAKLPPIRTSVKIIMESWGGLVGWWYYYQFWVEKERLRRGWTVKKGYCFDAALKNYPKLKALKDAREREYDGLTTLIEIWMYRHWTLLIYRSAYGSLFKLENLYNPLTHTHTKHRFNPPKIYRDNETARGN